eukprot:119204-Alexandrium_andersonii.AAC.1
MRAAAAGGVAVFAKKEFVPQQLAPRTEAFQRAFESGRAAMLMVGLSTGAPFIVVTVYGWANDEAHMSKADMTSSLFHDVTCKLEAWPELPVIILGDHNAEPRKIPSARLALESNQWVDVGER